MNFQIFDTYETLSESTASFILDYVRKKPDALICVPSGDSPRLAFQKIVAAAQPKDFEQVTVVALDEWVGIPPENKGSCRYLIENDFVKSLNLRPDQFYYFDGMSQDLEAECTKINQLIAKHGGLDIMFVGLGINGHIGLNEPGSSFQDYAHVSELAESTISVGQKYFSSQTALTQGITIGLKHLLEAKIVILIANGIKKTNIVKRIQNETVSEQLPASILKLHPNAYFWVDEAAANPQYHDNEVSLINAVDCAIFGFYNTELHILLHKFPYDPFKGHWALLGGFVLPEVSIDDSARQTLQHLTGLKDVYMEQIYTFGNVKRVPTERVITTCYYALIEVEPTLAKLTPEFGATWHSISEVSKLELVYDHYLMFEKALEQLRRKVRYQPIGFELLPEKFTMTELRNLYESILGRDLDRRNFSKKVLSMNLLQKLKEKQKGTSRRGAFFFRFDQKRYQELLAKGFLFEV